MGKTGNTALRCILVSMSLAGPAVCGAGENKPPPFPISQESQQLASDYLVCATGVFEKKYTGTVKLDEAVDYSLGQCADAQKRAHDSILKDAKKGGCESCAPEVMAEMDKEVRHKLTGEVDYEEEAQRMFGL